MSWLTRLNWGPSDKLHSDDVNNIGHDLRFWGGNVDGGGFILSNVTVVPAAGKAGTGGGVTSWNGQTGDVMPRGGGVDYTAAMVQAVPLTRKLIPGPGIVISGGGGTGGQLSADVTLAAAFQSFNTRTGAVVMVAKDVTDVGGVLASRQVATPINSGLQGGGPLSGDLNLSVVSDSTNQQVQLMSAGINVGQPRHAINFISGTGALVTVTENSQNNRIDVKIDSTGSGGFVDPTTTQGDLIARGLAAPAGRLAIGSDAQVLTVDHNQPQFIKWATVAPPPITTVFGRIGVIVASAADGYTAAMISGAVDKGGSYPTPPWIKSLDFGVLINVPPFMADPTSQRGDLIVRSASAITAFPVGVDGSVLTADSSMARGIRWSPPFVTSVFGRTGGVVPGAVVAQSGDYDVSQVTNAVSTLTTINTGLGLTGGHALNQNLTLSVVPNTTTQQIEIWQEGTTKVGTRKGINFKSGSGVALTITDGGGGTTDWVNVTVASSGTGSGGGMVDPTAALGDIIVRTAILPAPPTALSIGTQGQVLTVDTTQAGKMRWATPSGGGAGSQTPWLGPIDAAGNVLNNAQGIGANIAAAPASGRVYALVSGTEQAFLGQVTNPANVASLALVNDNSDTVQLRCYGTGYVGGFPGFASLEANKPLVILASGSEVMRLITGRVLIGTTTDDTINKLQVNGKVKSKIGGFVFPDDTVQTTAYVAAGSVVTSFIGRSGAVVAKTTAPFDYSAAIVTNAVDSSTTYNDPVWINTLAYSKITGKPAILVDPTTTLGDLIVRGAAAPATRLGVGTNGQVLTADSAAPSGLGVKWAAGSQTPWTSNIDGGGFTLFNAGKVGIGMATLPTARLHVVSSATGIVAKFDNGAAGDTWLQILSNGGVGGYFGFLSSSNGLAFLNSTGSATPNFLVTDAGLVGFGTPTPPCKLSTVLTRATAFAAGDATTWADVIIENATTAVGAATGIGFNVSGYHGNGSVVAGIACQRMVGPSGDASSDLVFLTRAQNVTQAEAMRLSQAGCLGVGVTVPSARIEALGAGAIGLRLIAQGTASNNVQMRYGGGSTSGDTWAIGTDIIAGNGGLDYTIYSMRAGPRLVVTDSAVGFGCNPTAYTIQVAAANPSCCLLPAANQWGLFQIANGTNTFHMSLNGSTAGSIVQGAPPFCAALSSNGNYPLLFATQNVGRMVILGNGNVGVANMSPTCTLAVGAGGLQIADYLFGPGGQVVLQVTDAFLRINASGSFTSGIWVSSSNISMYTGHLYLGSGGGAAGCIDLSATGGDQINRITLNGNANANCWINTKGLFGLGTAAPTGLFTVIPVTNPTSVATATQIQIGEASDNPGYRMNLGFAAFVGGSGWGGVIQCNPSGAGGVSLSLNPNGGYVAINKGSGGAGFQLDVTGDVNCTGAFRINGTAINTSGGGIQGISVQINSGGNQPGPFTWLNFYQLTGIAISSGGISGPGNNTFTIQIGQASDLRLKRNVQTLEGGLALIDQLRPVTGEYNGLGYTREGLKLTSVIAQELREVIPGAVEPYRTKLRPEDEEETELLAIDQMAIISHLILSIQQLNQRLKALEGVN